MENYCSQNPLNKLGDVAMNNIPQQLQQIHQQIEQACHAVGREQSAVKLLAVSKTKPVEDILIAHATGVEKIQYCQQHDVSLEWHFIGPLQSNKTRLVAEYFDWMQTLERAKIAERLNEQRPPYKAPLNVLIQINISQEASKSGIQPCDMLTLAKHIENLPHLRLRGLMAIPEPTDDMAQQEQTFCQMKTLFEQLQQALPNAQIDTLSMGMTDDMQSAIKCGSTMVRIGTAIFGKRDYAK